MNFGVEFLNEAGLSKYPFADGCSLVARNGFELPPEFMVDASFCFRGSGVPELSSLSSGRGVFSANGVEVAEFRYSGPGAVPVFDLSSGRETGVVVLGSGAKGTELCGFDDGAAVLCPSCFRVFRDSMCVHSISDGHGAKLHGAVRIHGSNGVYVTKFHKDGKVQLKIDIIGPVPVTESCCDDPVRGFAIWSHDCPVVAAVPVLYPALDNDGVDDFIPGVVALTSPLSADAVCGNKEKFVNPDGTISSRYCDRKPDEEETPVDCIESGPYLVAAANGNIDFTAYRAMFDPPNPIEVEVFRVGGQALASLTDLSSSSAKNLAISANSGSVSVKLKGRK